MSFFILLVLSPQLANVGIVNGYPDGTFKGQNNITRYEMAQMIAKAMANQDRTNAEQQAMINRLADEFSNELNNLGVRVARLENRVGNVKVTGDVRLRYLGSQEKDGKFVNDGTNMRGLAYVSSYRGYRGWLATAHYALQDNVGVTGYYGFNNKTNKSIGDNDTLPNYYRVDLNYQF